MILLFVSFKEESLKLLNDSTEGFVLVGELVFRLKLLWVSDNLGELGQEDTIKLLSFFELWNSSLSSGFVIITFFFIKPACKNDFIINLYFY